jgi:hypothetical protein
MCADRDAPAENRHVSFGGQHGPESASVVAGPVPTSHILNEWALAWARDSLEPLAIEARADRLGRSR